MAINKESTASDYRRFNVIDIPGGFGFDIPNSQSQERLFPVKEDRLVLVCKAHIYSYQPPELYWLHNNVQVKVETGPGRTVAITSNKHSHILTLTIESIQFEDQGQYFCQATNTDLAIVKKSVEMYVRSIQKPDFIKPLEGTVQIEPGIQHVLECLTKGLPIPTIEWFKDNKPYDASKDNLVSFSANKTRLMFKRAENRHSGVYTCQASNRGGSITSNMTLLVQIGGPTTSPSTDKPTIKTAHIILIVFAILAALLLIVIVLVICACRHYRAVYIPIADYLKPINDSKYNPDMPLDEQTDCLGYDPQWEFAKERLKFDIMLGQGAFGKVMRAEAFNEHKHSTFVAVKMVKDVSDREQTKALLSELKVLIHLGQHVNILNLIGACTKEINKGTFYVIVEYCKYGSIRSFLLKKRSEFIDTLDDEVKWRARDKKIEAGKDAIKAGASSSGLNYINIARSSTASEMAEMGEDEWEGVPLTTKDLLCYAFQIARGMEYLSLRKVNFSRIIL